MASASSTFLVDALCKFPLLEPGQLEEVVQLLSIFPDPKALAGELIRRGWLTPYQANQLLQNKGGALFLGGPILLYPLWDGGTGPAFQPHPHNPPPSPP